MQRGLHSGPFRHGRLARKVPYTRIARTPAICDNLTRTLPSPDPLTPARDACQPRIIRCQACPAGKYKPSRSVADGASPCLTCPVNSTSSPASTRCFCPENHFGSMTRNHTRANCVACPANAVSAPGSVHSSACQCAAGFYGQFPCVWMRGDVWVPLMCACARSVFFRGVQYQGCAQETPRLAASAVGRTPLPQ